jgi:adenylate cyclase
MKTSGSQNRNEEIERKFLVNGYDFKHGIEPVHIRQGFISTHKEHVIRIRTCGQKAFITLKSSGSGITRKEYEYEIPYRDAAKLFETFCLKPLIEKNRYPITYKGAKWDVDEFLGVNQGLVLAEIELDSENESFEKPPWLGEEVTGDPRYYNARLAVKPYTSW